MKTTKEFREDQVDELKKPADAPLDAHKEGELDDDSAGEVSGGFAFVPVQIPPEPPVTPV